jgi:hypothetical protein
MSTSKSDSDGTELDPASEQRIKELLRGVVTKEREEPEVPDVLGGVQEKLRIRSGGKFYDDAWSTARHAPVSFYFITSVIMLAILAVSYFILQPLSGRPETVRNQPADVEVVAPLPRSTSK